MSRLRKPLARLSLLSLALCAGPLGAGAAKAADLVLNGTTVTLGGVQTYDNVFLWNGASIVVPAYDGIDRINTGNLVLKARRIIVDATSSIVAKGRGYQAVHCGDGNGPACIAGSALGIVGAGVSDLTAKAKGAKVRIKGANVPILNVVGPLRVGVSLGGAAASLAGQCSEHSYVEAGCELKGATFQCSHK